jgi:hypothetical protein
MHITTFMHITTIMHIIAMMHITTIMHITHITTNMHITTIVHITTMLLSSYLHYIHAHHHNDAHPVFTTLLHHHALTVFSPTLCALRSHHVFHHHRALILSSPAGWQLHLGASGGPLAFQLSPVLLASILRTAGLIQSALATLFPSASSPASDPSSQACLWTRVLQA